MQADLVWPSLRGWVQWAGYLKYDLVSSFIRLCVAPGVADQADLRLDDFTEAAGLWGGAEAGGRDNDAGHHRDVPGDRRPVSPDTHQDTLSLQPTRHLQGSALFFFAIFFFLSVMVMQKLHTLTALCVSSTVVSFHLLDCHPWDCGIFAIYFIK